MCIQELWEFFKDLMEIVLALSTFGLFVFTAMMAFATRKLATESREASIRQIGVLTWLELSKRFDSSEMKIERKILAQAFIRDPKLPPHVHAKTSEMVMNFFEDVGVLYFEGHVDKKLAVDAFGFYACRWWEITKEYVDGERMLHNNDETLFCEFEKFATIAKSKKDLLDKAELQIFLMAERDLYVTNQK
jgi:hypothetical protein